MKKDSKKTKQISRLALVALVLALAVACGTPPATLDELPVYPGATVIEPGQNSLADSVANAMRESAGQQGLNAQFRLFSLPADTTWEQVQSFYKEQLAALDWKPEPSMTVGGEGFQAVGWSRGSGNSQQALVVGYVPDVTGEGAFAILGLMGR